MKEYLPNMDIWAVLSAFLIFYILLVSLLAAEFMHSRRF